MWTTPESVRIIVGLSSEEAPDEDILPHIYRAQRTALHDMAVYVRDDTLSGDIDGVNTIFTTTNRFIADRNFDLVVNTSDIDVYKWGVADLLEFREAVVVGSIDANYGKVYLSSAPSATFAVVTATYYYYPKEVDMNLIPEACSQLASYYFVMAEYLLIPEQLSHGAYRYRVAKPWEYLFAEYQRIKTEMVSLPFGKDTHDDIEQIRRETTQ